MNHHLPNALSQDVRARRGSGWGTAMELSCGAGGWACTGSAPLLGGPELQCTPANTPFSPPCTWAGQVSGPFHRQSSSDTESSGQQCAVRCLTPAIHPAMDTRRCLFAHLQTEERESPRKADCAACETRSPCLHGMKSQNEQHCSRTVSFYQTANTANFPSSVYTKALSTII